MYLPLSRKSEKFVQEKLESGSYATATEVIEDALLLLERRDRARAFEQSLIEADESIDRGEGIEWHPGLFDELWEQAEENVRQGILPDSDVCP
jgi:putative addiction module CopG family antidote